VLLEAARRTLVDTNDANRVISKIAAASRYGDRDSQVGEMSHWGI